MVQLARQVTNQKIKNFWDNEGVFRFELGGVVLYLNRFGVEYYIETPPEFGQASFDTLAALAEQFGYEIMPEWECPTQVLPNGNRRYWMAEEEDHGDITYY